MDQAEPFCTLNNDNNNNNNNNDDDDAMKLYDNPNISVVKWKAIRIP